MPSASLSAAANAAVSTSSTALGVAVTSSCRPPSVGSLSLLTISQRSDSRLGVQAALGDATPPREGYRARGLIPRTNKPMPRSGAWLGVQGAFGDVLHDAIGDQVPD